MAEQQSIQVNETARTIGKCEWCGDWATKKIIVRKSGWHKTSNGVKVKRPAVESWACDYHFRNIRRTTDV